MTVHAILFDLDGTLVDTAPDLVAVLNRLLIDSSRPPAAYAVARNHASDGALGLIRLGFGCDLPPGSVEDLRDRFLQMYSAALCVNSRIFEGLSHILDIGSSYRWGVVTNKPHAMTVPLLARLGLAERSGSIVSGDSLPQRKPHPAPLLLAAEELGVRPERCVYIGDAPRDIEAGRAAGMTTIAAAYGYIRPGTDVMSWGADLIVRHPAHLSAALAQLTRDDADDAA
ncbi:MAG: HAD-IA family hydrolase [Gammaproteobacteria bacterium]|nr:HAD-IA family hydrolase [Gammaproteobacteria bacterium]